MANAPLTGCCSFTSGTEASHRTYHGASQEKGLVALPNLAEQDDCSQTWDRNCYARNARLSAISPRRGRIAQSPPGRRILDLGCGDGILTQSSQPLEQLVVIDGSSARIEAARKLGLDARCDGWRKAFLPW